MAHSSPTSCAFNENHLIHEKTNLPSPPNSSCGDEREPELTSTTTPPQPPVVSSAHYTLENYTIDHSKPDITQHSQYTLKKSVKDHRVISAILSTSTKRSFQSSSTTTATSSSEEEENSDMDDATESSKRKKSTLSDTHRCNDCGKLYKHLKSLFKHQWEHSEHWEASSKLSLTKHQQVQLLEAASILTSMKKQTILNQQVDDDDNNDDDADDEEEGEISLI